MHARMDHLVLWVADQRRALEFYEKVVGLAAVRAEEFFAEKVPFPSVRVSPDSLIDLMPTEGAPLLGAMFGGEGSAGNRVSHLCLAMERDDYRALRARLQAAGVKVSDTLVDFYGARGPAPESFYFLDLDGNVLEARYYA
jgi:glyoxylase I family protein